MAKVKKKRKFFYIVREILICFPAADPGQKRPFGVSFVAASSSQDNSFIGGTNSGEPTSKYCNKALGFKYLLRVFNLQVLSRASLK